MITPAADVPCSGPCSNTRRVDATLKARRNNVIVRSRLGKTEKSSGRCAYVAVKSRIRLEAIDNVKKMSIMNDGKGTIISTRMPIKPPARRRSAFFAYCRNPALPVFSFT